jgi:hypothetical protein
MSATFYHLEPNHQTSFAWQRRSILHDVLTVLYYARKEQDTIDAAAGNRPTSPQLPCRLDDLEGSLGISGEFGEVGRLPRFQEALQDPLDPFPRPPPLPVFDFRHSYAT